MKNRFHFALLLLGILLLAACGEQGQQAVSGRPQVPAATLALGQQVYQQNCAACHGAQAEGAVDWRHRDADGLFPPPPLNGSGHMWHHSMADLVKVINDGSPAGQGRMPAWGQNLNAEQVNAVILWLQSLWPDEIHNAWQRMNQQS